MRRTRVTAGLAALVLLLSVAACGQPELTGTDLGETPAPDFTLTDFRGEPVSLRDFRGRAVALTFIYTNCPDVCPLIAEKLRRAYESLPESDRDRVALIAVTVDPARDTPEALQAFSERHRLADNAQWYALTGDRAALEPVWQAYYIDPGMMIDDAPHNEADHEHAPATSTTLAHTDAIFIIDPDGKERVLLRADVDPDVIAADLQALIG